jgi:hypothetical protein
MPFMLTTWPATTAQLRPREARRKRQGQVAPVPRPGCRGGGPAGRRAVGARAPAPAPPSGPHRPPPRQQVLQGQPAAGRQLLSRGKAAPATTPPSWLSGSAGSCSVYTVQPPQVCGQHQLLLLLAVQAGVTASCFSIVLVWQ